MRAKEGLTTCSLGHQAIAVDAGSVYECVVVMCPSCWRVRAESAEAENERLRGALEKIAEHAVCALPEETAPPRNRLQVIYSKATSALRTEVPRGE